MSMNKYIAGIIHCLDTVPSLKKALVKAFKGVENEITQATTVITGDVDSTFTKDTTYVTKIVKSGNVITLDLYLSGVTATGGSTVVGTIPVEFRPDNDFIDLGTHTGTLNRFAFKSTTGNIIPLTNISNQSVTLHTVYIK